jgi:predicted acetyltransferase
MTPELRVLDQADLPLLIARDAQSFAQPPGAGAEWFAAFPPEGLLGWYDGTTLLAQCTLARVQIATGSSDAPAALVGSVVSPPEHRRRGYVAAMITAVHRQLRAEARPFAMLYAFRESFYARFGYATAFERRKYSGDPALLAPFRNARAGRFVLATDADAPHFDVVYRAALRGRFGVLRRDTAYWHGRTLRNGRGAQYNYLWFDDAGTPRAYLLYSISREGHDHTLNVREIVARDPEARAQIFGFLADQDARVRSIAFQSPGDAPVNLLLPDPLHCEVIAGPMLRIVDVPPAFAAYSTAPAVSGALVLGIADASLPENSGSYQVEFASGTAHAVRSDATPQLHCTIEVLAQLFSRTLRPRTAAAFGMLAGDDRAALALLEQAFAGPAGFCGDGF